MRYQLITTHKLNAYHTELSSFISHWEKWSDLTNEQINRATFTVSIIFTSSSLQSMLFQRISKPLKIYHFSRTLNFLPFFISIIAPSSCRKLIYEFGIQLYFSLVNSESITISMNYHKTTWAKYRSTSNGLFLALMMMLMKNCWSIRIMLWYLKLKELQLMKFIQIVSLAVTNMIKW